jgi:hypothetical protein
MSVFDPSRASSASSPIPEIASHVRIMTNKDGAVLLEIKRGLMFSLNPVATKIWQLLDTGHSKEQISERLVNDYGIARERAASDVDDLIHQLEAHKLVSLPGLQVTKQRMKLRMPRWMTIFRSKPSCNGSLAQQSRDEK